MITHAQWTAEHDAAVEFADTVLARFGAKHPDRMMEAGEWSDLYDVVKREFEPYADLIDLGAKR